MATVTVVPNATASGASLFTITGGATLHSVLSDASDGSYIMKTSTILGQGSAILDFGTTTISAGTTIKRVRIRGRVSTPTSIGKLNIYLGSRISNQNYFFSALTVRAAYTSATTFTGAWQTAAPDGSNWSQASINNLRAKITEYNDSADIGKFYELYIDVETTVQPTVTISAPSGTITTTASPDVTWTYNDTDNNTQDYYRAIIYTAAQYGIGGFTPGTSPSTWDSGDTASSDSATTVNTLLLSGTYRIYMRVGKLINNAPYWSDYSFGSFTIANSAPTVPTLIASWNASLGYSSFTITGAAPTGFSSQYFQLQRSDDGGTTYTTIRNGSNITPSGSYVGIASDYEAYRGVVAYYRARAVGVDSNSVEFPSAYTTVVQVLATNDGTWWFKAVTSPSINLGSVRVLKELDVNIQEPNTVFRVLGSTRPTVIAGPIQGQDGGYNIKTINETEWDNLDLLLTYQGILLVQDPYGNQKYVRVINREWTAEQVSGNIYRDVTLTYVEVNG